MVAADKPVISVGRAQDWINTINPILDGLKRELRFLPKGPWQWHPRTRSFETFLPVGDYLQHPYLDNYDDLVEKHDILRQEFVVHDRILAAFAAEIGRAVDVLTEDQGSFKNELDNVVRVHNTRMLSARRVRSDVRDPDEASAAPPDSRAWFASYVAGNFERVPDYYVGYESYNERNERSDRLLASGRDVLAQAGIDVANHAKQLADEDAKLSQQLVDIRRELADRYGARIRPS